MDSPLKQFFRSALRKKCRWFPSLRLTTYCPSLLGPKARLLAWLENDPVSIQGSTMYLDAVDSLGLRRRRIYEPRETKLVQDWVKPGNVILDIGANIGYYTLLFARLTGPGGRVFAFEPDPRCFALLQRNISENNYAQVSPRQMAVSDQTGELTLHQSELNLGDNRLRGGNATGRICRVPAGRLDDVLATLVEPVSLIKMDVQGAEATAVRGMRTLLTRQKSCAMLMEFSPDALREFGDDPAELLADLESQGFVLREILSRAPTTRTPTLAELRANLAALPAAEVNLWLVKQA